MSTSGKNLKQWFFRVGIIGLAVMRQSALAFARKVMLSLVYFRGDAIRLLKDSQPLLQDRPKVIAILAHIVSTEEATDQQKAEAKISKLRHTIDGLLSSFAHCELVILISTLPGRHITAYLPAYQRHCIEVIEAPDCDPMYVGFRVQDEFTRRLHQFDWFLFIEDDIVVYDSSLLLKIAKFNQRSGYKNAVLLPNRYEMWEGRKNYIDLTIDSKAAWSRLTMVEIEGIKYAECTNPHSAFYCLSRTQMEIWMRSGQSWKNKDVMVGPLESAATFCLLECFSLYKPHPANLHFLEVRHYDTKYSKLLLNQSPYTISSK